MWECRFDEMSCGKGNRCIPLTWRCDGRAHCKDNSDERECTTTHCANNEYHCINQNICIPVTWRCDGMADCSHSEDEKLCGIFIITNTDYLRDALRYYFFYRMLIRSIQM